VQSVLATLGLAAGFGGVFAMNRARRPFRAWARASNVRATGGPASVWQRLYGRPEPDAELEAKRREARRWHACAAGLFGVALALSVAAALS
jgi:hypothetical protein